MSQKDIKSWERPWSTQEMIENASNWSLAGDSGLLQYLEDFSEKMLSKVKDTNDRLNDLVDKADETSLALQNATNKFMGLRNTQFIESRVYEDDETLPTKQIPEKEEKLKQTDSERLEEMKKAICNGLDIIDKYYEKVEIPESDSEDDTDGPNILYRPIDPYIDRPLPYVIGSYDWQRYWHVGLGHSSSDSDTENDQDQFSETESEQEIQNLPERDRTQIPGISDSESEDLPKNKMSKPVANSTFNDHIDPYMFDSTSDSDIDSLPPQVNTVNSNFAEELAAKLGKVESTNIEPEVNTKPIKKQTSNIAGGLFSDEPPPLNDDDIFSKKNMNSGLFSGGDNLFDDVDDDNDFWNIKGTAVKPNIVVTNNSVKDDLFTEENEDIFYQQSNKQKETFKTQQTQKSAGLFDEDDDLFSTASITQSKKTILTSFKTTAPLVSDEPPELEPTSQKEETKKKKPVGGVSVLGPNVLLKQEILKNRPPSSSDSDYDAEAVKIVKTSKELKKNEISKVSSIFDDTSPLFSDDIFNTSSNKLFTSNLFESSSSASSDLLKENKESEIVKTEQTQEADEIKSDKIIENTKPNLFLDEPPPLSQSINKKSSLFDNDDNIDDDLFSTKSKTDSKGPQTMSNSKYFSKTSNSLFDNLEDDSFNNKSNESISNKSKVDLFDPNPPELDESDNKSESQSQLSLDNEPSSYNSMNVGRASLFDTEPPILSNESSGIVKDQSTSRFEEDSSFYPYLTSSRRHSDFSQDQSDSLLSGKNKLSVPEDLNPNLSKISEGETVTKIDITPSGNKSSAFYNSSLPSNESSDKKPIADDLFSKDKQNNKPVSLFDDSITNVNLFKEPNKAEQEKGSLFQDSASIPNLFKEPKPEKREKKNISLFQESDSDEDDLFSNKSSGSKNSSTSDILNNSSMKPIKTLKNKNIFEDDIFSGPNIDGIPDVDIFNKTKNLENSSSDEFNNTKNVTDKNDDLFVQNKISDTKKFNYEENLKSDEVVKIDPKKSLSFEKNIDHEKKENKKEETDGQILSTGSSPGKLKHNLNINVTALIPGASPPRRQNLEKSISLDSSEGNQNALVTEETTKLSEKYPKPIEKSISFDQPVDTGEILTSANKERVKIPVRRRPSTRRARQEAIRKSAIDLNFEEAVTESDKNNEFDSPPDKIATQNILNLANNNITEKSKGTEENKIKNPLLNPLSPSTDEEDFLTMPREKDLSSENFRDTLFGKAPIISPVDSLVNEDENKKNINSSDKANDLFEKNDNKKTDEIVKSKVDLFHDTDEIFVTQKQTALPKKTESSIFSSSDSENDLFNTPKINLKKTDNNNLVTSPDEDLFKPVPSTTSKLQNKILLKQDSLFEDEDIFSTKKIPPKSVIIKKSLFDDEDDNDDDIFGESSLVSKSNTQRQNTSSRRTSTSKLKKISSNTVQDIDDPLEALKK